MARSRYLKPGFFKNEGLAALRPAGRTTTPAAAFAARLCFEGLWVLADRAGRLEDRPKRIKAEIFPYDDVDVEALLIALSEHGFIVRYVGEGDGEAYIAVRTFPKHQHPHIREPASQIPAPPPPNTNGARRQSTRPAPGSHRAGPAESESESESELRTKTVQPANLKQGSPMQRAAALFKKKHGREKYRGRFR